MLFEIHFSVIVSPDIFFVEVYREPLWSDIPFGYQLAFGVSPEFLQAVDVGTLVVFSI
jgi:hypothetical protein